MRQFVLGLIVAGLAWWGYDKWLAVDPAPSAEPGGSTSQPSARGSSAPVEGDLRDMLGGVGVTPASGGGTSLEAATTGTVTSDIEASGAATSGGGADDGAREADLDKILPLVKEGDANAISVAWAAVAAGDLGRDHDRVVNALAPRAEDFSSQLAALGVNNAFLHSTAGRNAADKVLKVAMALPDSEAVKAGSQLVYLMTRGRIQRGDLAVRAAVDNAYTQHRIRVDRWTCNPSNVAGARSYEVQPGNSLDIIARKFRREGIKIEAGTIALLNRISNPNLLRAGQQLKIPVAPVSALLEKRSFSLMVFVGDELIRLYWVGHGEHDRTPVTEFTVIAKQEKPDWTAPDGNVYPYGSSENILGEHFIKFGHAQFSGFGAHGTPMKDTICTMSSMGCIRMFDQNIAELFRILPRGAKVVVRSTESVR
mgnify:CR=1 FL=1